MQLNATYKGFPGHLAPIDLKAVGAQQWHVLKGDLPFPLAVIRQSALLHNLQWMQNFCNERDLDIAPHGKTTMSPELYHLQLDAGAWGISFATVFQASMGARHGVKRIIIANQVYQAPDLDALAGLLSSYPDLRVYFLIDSAAQLEAITQWRMHSPSKADFTVLIELGIEGQRTGCRDHAQALDLARRIKATAHLQLCGIETYEGALATCNHAHDETHVAALMARVQQLAMACEAEDLFEHDEVMLTAGGSAIFDLVAKNLKPHLKRPARGILRSGCYLTHDHVQYRKMLQCVGERLNLRETLKPALEVIASVQSCPEPGLALLTMGKRDVSYDLDLPVALWRATLGDAQTRGVPAHWQLTALNDQHAYLRYDASAPLNEQPQLGQLVGCGISHPCTTFDKWRWMPVIDDQFKVVSAISVNF
jgi:D-serine dehydratase